MPRLAQLTAAYGLFYLENRPILLRAVGVDRPITPALLTAARDAGFNAIRPVATGLLDESEVAAYGLTTLALEPASSELPSLEARPFAVAIEAQRAAAYASESSPATLWRLPAEPLVVACAVARGARGYSVTAPPESWAALAPLQSWFAEREEELTASVTVLDGLACIQTPVDRLLLEGGFGVLAVAGYNPPIVDLAEADDAALAEYLAALYACNGELDLDDYGKLVVLTLRGATLVTYPRPVERTTDGVPYRTSFLWPSPARPPAAVPTRDGQRALGRRVQVRDGVSTLLAEPLGEPYAGADYYRLPEGQRAAHRDLVLSLFGEALTRTIEPERKLEVEVIARLSPDGGALLFVINRLGAQAGQIELPDLGALQLASEFVVSTLFAAAGSTATRRHRGVYVEMQPSDVLVLRLG